MEDEAISDDLREEATFLEVAWIEDLFSDEIGYCLLMLAICGGGVETTTACYDCLWED